MDMMRRYASMLNKGIRILIIPFLTPRLSSYWVDLVTPVSASLARPLIDSLKHEATVRDDSVKEFIPILPKPFELAMTDALREGTSSRNVSVGRERTSKSLNTRVLAVALVALAAFGSAYYVVDRAADPFQPGNLTMLFLWYIGIAFALYFIRQGARLGSFVAGLVGWTTLAFWLFEGRDLFLFTASSGLSVAIARGLDLLGIVTVCIEIVASHNVFHKLRMFGR
jgi:hypothetical protein